MHTHPKCVAVGVTWKCDQSNNKTNGDHIIIMSALTSSTTALPTASQLELFKTASNPVKVDIKASAPVQPPKKKRRLATITESPTQTTTKAEANAFFDELEAASSVGGGSSEDAADSVDEASSVASSDVESTLSDRATARLHVERESEKHNMLQELNAMRRAGIPVSNFGVNDELHQIEWEYKRAKMQQDTDSVVSFMSQGLVMLCSGAEMLNKRFPVMHLEGWSAKVAEDQAMYQPPLRKIYKKYWRKGGINPFMHLGFLLVSSAVGHHMSHKLLGSRAAERTPPPPPSMSSSASPRRRATSNPMPSPAPLNQTIPVRRKTMRRPVMPSSSDAASTLDIGV